jgi:hypothetical protein
MMKKITMLLFLCTVCISWNASAFDSDQIQIHGFASQGYLQSNHYDYFRAQTEEGTIEFNEFGLNVMSNLTDKLRMGIQVFARDFEDIGNSKVTIDWAFGEYRYRNWAGIRVGKFKKAMGMYNQSRDIDMARTGVFLPTSVYDEATRRVQKSIIGAMAYGNLPRGFEYQAQYGTLDPEVEEESSNPDGIDAGDNAYALYLAWNTPVNGLKLVGTLGHFSMNITQSITIDDETTTQENTMGIDEQTVGVEYTRGAVTCAAEYRQIRPATGTGPQNVSEYYYGLLSYRVTDWVEVATSYAVSYRDKDDKEGKDLEQRGQPEAAAWLRDLAISARFDINEYWLVKLEGHWLNGLSGVSGYGDNPSEDGFLGAAKVTFSF